jgi:hypothetical protein
VLDETSVVTQTAFISQGDRTERVSKSGLQRIDRATMRARKRSSNPVLRRCALLILAKMSVRARSGSASGCPIRSELEQCGALWVCRFCFSAAEWDSGHKSMREN